MKILIKNDDKTVITAMEQTEIVHDDYIKCDDVIYAGCTLENCTIEEVIVLPKKFVGGCWKYENGLWTIINQYQIDLSFPTPTITMRQCRLELLKRGLYDAINNYVLTMPQAAQIEWEYSAVVKRDYGLVLELQKALSMSDSDIDLFFSSAVSI